MDATQPQTPARGLGFGWQVLVGLAVLFMGELAGLGIPPFDCWPLSALGFEWRWAPLWFAWSSAIVASSLVSQRARFAPFLHKLLGMEQAVAAKVEQRLHLHTGAASPVPAGGTGSRAEPLSGQVIPVAPAPGAPHA